MDDAVRLVDTHGQIRGSRLDHAPRRRRFSRPYALTSGSERKERQIPSIRVVGEGHRGESRKAGEYAAVKLCGVQFVRCIFARVIEILGPDGNERGGNSQVVVDDAVAAAD